MSTPDLPPVPCLLDERARPDLPAVFRSLAARSGRIDVALNRIRLSGVRLGPDELGEVQRLRLLVVEVNAVTLGREADALLVHPERRRTLRFLLDLLQRGRIEIRCAPLGGWSPDFSIFSGPEGPRAALVGPHWFERPCPHPGPVLTACHGPDAGAMLLARFEQTWAGAHDVGEALVGIMEAADARVPASAHQASATAAGPPSGPVLRDQARRG